MGRPKPSGPRFRKNPSGTGGVLDRLDGYVAEVAGTPPPDFKELVELAQKLTKLAASTCGIDPTAEYNEAEELRIFAKLRDAMLIAAYSYSFGGKDGTNENPIGFVSRAKSVVDWCKRPLPELTELGVLERKARALAHMIASRLFRGEGFVLLIFNEQENGHVTWLSSTRRSETLKQLRTSLDNIEATERIHTQ